MSFAIIDLVGNMFITVFGNPYLVAAIVAGFIILFLLAVKADITVILMVMIPFVIGIGINAVTSNIINIPTWIILATFMIAGLIFSSFIIYLMR